MQLKLVSNRRETPDTHIMRFLPDKKVEFKPGQFMLFQIPAQMAGKDTILKRSYSLASTPSQQYLEFVVKSEGGVASKTLYALPENAEIVADGPFGMFAFTEAPAEELVFIAGGSGIGPFMSIIRHILEKKIKCRIKLLFSVKTPADIIYRQELEELKKLNGNFECAITLTRHEDLAWKGLTGRIDEEKIKSIASDIMSAVFYICGPTKMAEAVMGVLIKMGVARERIKVERFGPGEEQ